MLPALLGLAVLAASGGEGCGALALADVSRSAGLHFVHERGASGEHHLPETMGSGLAWLDYDGDGWLDLYAVQSGPFPGGGDRAANRLYRNRGDGRDGEPTFEDVTEASAAGHRGYGQGVVAADADGDGRSDLYLTNFGSDALLLNRGSGRFEDVTVEAGLGLGGWSSSAAFADYDQDGYLDLYVARYVGYDLADPLFCAAAGDSRRDYCHPSLFRGAGDRLYRNRGDATFEERAAIAGAKASRGLGVLFADLDGDHLADLYVANDLDVNFLYRNRGDGTFEDLSLLSGAGLNGRGEAEAGMGVAAGDVDGDGDPELMVTHFDVETNTLYKNLGGMIFEDVSAQSGFGPASFNQLGFGIAAADFDSDGDLDVYVANGHIQEDPQRQGVGYAEGDLLLVGDGEGGFVAAECGPAFELEEVGRGVAAADYDNDGDPDLAVLNSGGRLRLLRNEGTPADWIGLDLRGRLPNGQAVGARVRLTTSNGRRTRWVTAGGSYLSSHDKRLLFALRTGEQILELRVTWPDGSERILAAPQRRRYSVVDEASGASSSRPPH